MRGIIDTGATGTLMPISTVEKLGLSDGITWLAKENYLKVNGIGGEGYIIGIHLDMPVTLGSSVVQCRVGILDRGSFDLLLGNDSTKKFKLSLNVDERTCTYQYLILGM